MTDSESGQIRNMLPARALAEFHQCGVVPPPQKIISPPRRNRIQFSEMFDAASVPALIFRRAVFSAGAR